MTKLKILESIKIGKLELKNRVVMAPMCTYETRSKDGVANDFHKVHYAARALGGVGLINIEATAVEANGRISELDLGLWNQEQADKLAEIVALLHQFGAKVAIQLAHAGRKAKNSDEVLAPSAIAFSSEYEVPLAMEASQIERVVSKFKQSATYAKQIGVDVIELHAAHGYLLNQFLSPLTNQREDEYGGSLENRYRILKRIIAEVKLVFDGDLWVRLSAKEYSEEGNCIEDIIQIAKWLKEDGIALIDVSTGGVVDCYPDAVYAGYQVPSATKIREGADIPVAAVGLLNDAKLAEYILQSEQADLICLGRPLLANPNWLQRAVRDLGADDEWKAYNASYDRGRTI